MNAAGAPSTTVRRRIRLPRGGHAQPSTPNTRFNSSAQPSRASTGSFSRPRRRSRLTRRSASRASCSASSELGALGTTAPRHDASPASTPAWRSLHRRRAIAPHPLHADPDPAVRQPLDTPHRQRRTQDVPAQPLQARPVVRRQEHVRVHVVAIEARAARGQRELLPSERHHPAEPACLPAAPWPPCPRPTRHARPAIPPLARRSTRRHPPAARVPRETRRCAVRLRAVNRQAAAGVRHPSPVNHAARGTVGALRARPPLGVKRPTSRGSWGGAGRRCSAPAGCSAVPPRRPAPTVAASWTRPAADPRHLSAARSSSK